MWLAADIASGPDLLSKIEALGAVERVQDLEWDRAVLRPNRFPHHRCLRCPGRYEDLTPIAQVARHSLDRLAQQDLAGVLDLVHPSVVAQLAYVPTDGGERVTLADIDVLPTLEGDHSVDVLRGTEIREQLGTPVRSGVFFAPRTARTEWLLVGPTGSDGGATVELRQWVPLFARGGSLRSQRSQRLGGRPSSFRWPARRFMT